MKRFNDETCQACTITGVSVVYAANEPYSAAWKRADYSYPDWWQASPTLPDRMGESALTAGAEYPPGRQPDRRPFESRPRRRADRKRPARREADPSPHFDGRAQPGDVLGVETGGERTYIGDTAEDENKRRRGRGGSRPAVRRTENLAGRVGRAIVAIGTHSASSRAPIPPSACIPPPIGAARSERLNTETRSDGDWRIRYLRRLVSLPPWREIEAEHAVRLIRPASTNARSSADNRTAQRGRPRPRVGELRRADDRRGHARLREQPRQRHLRRLHAEARGELDDAIGDREVGVGVIQFVGEVVGLGARRVAAIALAADCRRGSRAPAGSTGMTPMPSSRQSGIISRSSSR